MPSRRFELQRVVTQLAAWLLAIPGMLALLLAAGSSLAAVPCHQVVPGAAAAHSAMQDPASHSATTPAMMDAVSAMDTGTPCTGHVPGAPCCATAFCGTGGWLVSLPPPCPAPASALPASGHAPPPAGGPGAPSAPDLPPPRRA